MINEKDKQITAEDIQRVLEFDSKRTPEDWDICDSANSNFIHVEVKVTGEQIATVNRGCREERINNALFMAAAPLMAQIIRHQKELLEECERVLTATIDVQVDVGGKPVDDATALEMIEWRILPYLTKLQEATGGGE
jgi:hypothetical protein